MTIAVIWLVALGLLLFIWYRLKERTKRIIAEEQEVMRKHVNKCTQIR